jgi:hypothetical protein
MEEAYEDIENEEFPQGVSDNSDLIDKLINPELKGIENTNNPLLSRDLILGNFTEEDIEILKLYNELYEIGNLANNSVISWSSWLDSIGRRMKLVALITRGKGGFQNKMLKTNITISRRGIEQMPEEYD